MVYFDHVIKVKSSSKQQTGETFVYNKISRAKLPQMAQQLVRHAYKRYSIMFWKAHA